MKIAMKLYAPSGARLYVNADERERFLAAAMKAPCPTRSLCLTLVYTGCRISEALSITPISIQTDRRVMAIRTLKKRDQFHMREVPVPKTLIDILERDHPSHDPSKPDDTKRLWTISRSTAWRQVKAVMSQAGIVGTHASPKGLRHGFGVAAIQAGVPLNMVQKWMGHARIDVTAIYANAMGKEEYAVAERMW